MRSSGSHHELPDILDRVQLWRLGWQRHDRDLAGKTRRAERCDPACTKSAYIFGAICPASGEGPALVLLRCHHFMETPISDELVAYALPQ